MAGGDRLVHSDRTFGCLLISSPQGHSGKTIVTLGLCNVLRRRGFLIQPFKKGPDYIDPSWLTLAAGRSCRNLDLFLIPEEKLVQTFVQACDNVDLAVVEGAMGLFDGVNSKGTTAEIARVLKIPVLLVVNTTRMTGSIAAMVTGYQHFEKGIQIAGVVLNYVAGSRHEKKLKDAVEQYCGIPVVGSIPKDQDLRITERHLGLIPTSEAGEAEELVERMGQKLDSYLDLEAIVRIAQTFNTPHPASLPIGAREAFEENLFEGRGKPHKSPLPLGERDRVRGTAGAPKVRIGIIRDRAFNFYYPENLEAMMREEAELLFIDSFKDRLPRVDGLYIGGGFPEFFLKELEGNRRLRKDIAEAVEADLPVYAECAGLMYLSRKIHWKRRSYEMVGIIPAEVHISEKPEGHGYVVAEVMEENPFFPVGLTVRGHEFHHSRVSISIKNGVEFIYRIMRGHGIDAKRDGVLYKNMFAAYTHLHASGTPSWAQGFVSLAARVRRSLRGGRI
jgi:cobyrinic acid a,c-diamide synthase